MSPVTRLAAFRCSADRRHESPFSRKVTERVVGSMSRRNIFWLPQRSVDGAYGTIEPVGIFGFAEAGALGAMEAWAVVERHCSSVREAPGLDLQGPRVQRRHPAGAAAAVALGAEARRARGDFTRPRGRSVDAGDRRRAPAGTLHGQPRDRPPSRPRPLSSGCRRAARLGPRPSPEALSAGGAATTAAGCRQEAEPELVP